MSSGQRSARAVGVVEKGDLTFPADFARALSRIVRMEQQIERGEKPPTTRLVSLSACLQSSDGSK